MHMEGDERDGLKLIEWARVHAPTMLGIALTDRPQLLDDPDLMKAGAFNVFAFPPGWPARLVTQLKVAVGSAIRLREAASDLQWFRRFADPRLYEIFRKSPDDLKLPRRM